MAQVTVIANDLGTRMRTVSALEKSHDVCALSYPDPKAHPDRIAASEPDVVVVDLAVLSSPRGAAILDGQTHVHELPASGQLAIRTQTPAVLVLLEPGQEDLIIDCFKAGADDYLIKPVKPRELRGKINGLQAMRLGLLDTSAHPIDISPDRGLFLYRSA